MSDDTENLAAILRCIREQVASGAVRVTLHASGEMTEEGISLDDVSEAIASGDAEVVENYPDHRRGACCLVAGRTQQGRPLHVVCTSAQPAVIIITVYEPKPPKWITPNRRSPR
jgi:hypothetical protein